MDPKRIRIIHEDQIELLEPEDGKYMASLSKSVIYFLNQKYSL